MQNSILPIQKLRSLLEMEYQAEKEEYKLQSERMSIRRKIRRGICWYPIQVKRSYYNALGQLVAEIEKVASEEAYDTSEDIEHCFEYGRPVVFFTHSEQGMHFLPSTHTISFAEEQRMVVTVPSTQSLIDLQATESLGVQLYFDETSYRTMFHALDDVLKARNNRLAELRDLFAGQGKPELFTFAPMSFPWLNQTQEEAVNKVLVAKDVAIVHGPPGTGKTTTLVEAIHETLRRETQVMVCAQSNMAVDWICEKLTDYGISVLRIGNPSRINDKMLSSTYERKFEAHPDYPTLWSIRKTLRTIKEKREKGAHAKIARLRERATELEMRITANLFDEARVIACTLVGSANKLLVGHKFSTLFIDEAAQALEPACWIAIRRAHRVVLAGDYQQLPPTIKCYDALKQGLGDTLMERIAKNQPQAVCLLRTQYRMNEQIMRFSSEWFYQGQVEADKSVRARSILDFDNPITWIDTSEMKQTNTADTEDLEQSALKNFYEDYVGENHGRINKAEAELTLDTLEQYIGKIGRQRFVEERLDVGIISPYRVQAQYIRQQLRRRDALRPLKSVIDVHTVDGFQGQERDIILISLVRSNDHGQIGFLSDLRRMNVAMTRARMKLIIIGNAQTLTAHPFYRKLKQYIDQCVTDHSL